MRVGDGKRIASLAVASGEVAFEIHAPQLIRTRHQRERFRAWRGALPLPLRTGQARATQNVTEGASCRPNHVRLEHFQPCLEFARAPGRMLGTKHEDSVLHRLKRRVGTGMRAAAAVHESFWSRLVVTVDPAVGCWTRDSIRATQVRY